MTLQKTTLLAIALTMIAALLACSSNSSSAPPPPSIVLSVTSGNNQSTAVGTAFGAALVATVTSNGTPASGVTVTFAAPSSGASCALGSTTATTNASGQASATCTANSTTGTYSVTASTNGATPVNFTLTNSSASATPPLAAGNYAFRVTGTNVNGTFFWAGVFTVTTSGTTSSISGGEQDYSDFGESAFISAEPLIGGSITTVGNGDTNLLITLTFTDPYINNGANNLVIDASMQSASEGLIMEYDDWGSGSGDLWLQTSTAAPSAGYAFDLTGYDDPNGNPMVIGGVVNIDSATGISGTGSVFDENDGGTLTSDQLFSASSFSGPDAMGLVTFTLNPAAGGTVTVDGYIVDSTHINLIENWGDGFGITAGVARGQGTQLTGTFSDSSIAGSTYVFGTEGNDPDGALQVAGALTFTSTGAGTGTVSGNLSFNDLTSPNPAQGGATISAGAYTIDGGATCSGPNDCGTGRVTVTGVTDGATFTYNLQLYLDGTGHATIISMDTMDVTAGIAAQQAASTFTADNFTGPYTVDLSGFTPAELISNSGEGTFLGEVDMVGVLTATPSSATAGAVAGYFDQNQAQLSGGALTTDVSSTANYASTSTNGVFTVTPTSGLFTYYMIDAEGDGAIIENDNTGLALGQAQTQQ